jgi:hypothetical protein
VFLVLDGVYDDLCQAMRTNHSSLGRTTTAYSEAILNLDISIEAAKKIHDNLAILLAIL